MVSSARLCLVCKGSRHLCGWKICPLYYREKSIPAIKTRLKEDFFGPSTSIFIGHNFYPNVYVGPLTTLNEEKLGIIDHPVKWFGKPYGEIIEMRSFVMRAKSRENIYSHSKLIEKNQEIALSIKPLDVEIKFRRKPAINFEFSDVIQPMGPSGILKYLKVTENPKIPRKIEKVLTDELKAEEAGFMLYKNGIDVYKLSVVLSSGILGYEGRKKLVPTRWSITAVDDMIAKKLISNIKTYNQINEYLVFSSEYLDNHFEFLFIPGRWEFENFEAWSPGTTWSFNLKRTEILEEYESFQGRTKYANLQAGGYYASRLAVVEYLHKIRKQATVVGFREVREGYTIPLGVWLVRETARNAFKSPPKKFSSLKDALNNIGTRLRIDIHEFLKRSKILRQKKLKDFYNL